MKNEQLIQEVLSNGLIQEMLVGDSAPYAEMIRVIRQHRIEAVLDINTMQALIHSDAETFAAALAEMERQRSVAAAPEAEIPAPLNPWQRFCRWVTGICRAIVSSK